MILFLLPVSLAQIIVGISIVGLDFNRFFKCRYRLIVILRFIQPNAFIEIFLRLRLDGVCLRRDEVGTGLLAKGRQGNGEKNNQSHPHRQSFHFRLYYFK